MKECVLEINAGHLKQNFQWYKNQSLNGFVCPMIKANAYGAGDLEVFQILKSAGATTFGVVRLSEAKTIRAIDKKVQLLLFNPCDEKDYLEVLTLNLTPVISNFRALEDLHVAMLNLGVSTYDVHIEFDTGMNRLGFKPYDLSELFEKLSEIRKIKVAGFFSHFVQAEDWPLTEGRSFLQLSSFQTIVAKFDSFLNINPELKSDLQYVKHLSSSKALNDSGFDADKNSSLIEFGLRPGLGLFGLSQKNKNLKTVLTLKAPIVDVKWCLAGETVSYDGMWRAQRDSLIATLPLGYGDGYPRALAGQSYVLIDEHRAPVVGKVCMDFIMVDLTDLVAMSDGDDLSSLQASDLKRSYKNTLVSKWMSKVALVFGDQRIDDGLTIEALSEKAGLISYEFIVRLSPRLKRKVVGL